MSDKRLLVLFAGFLLQVTLTYCQGCTEQTWCPTFQHLCTNVQYSQQMKQQCPKTCKSCIDPGPPPAQCSTNNGGCQHKCSVTNNKKVCSCNPGWKLDSNGLSCSDINECVGVNPCAKEVVGKHCVNGRGDYYCAEKQCSNTTGFINRYRSSECCRVEQDYPCGRDSYSFRIVGGRDSVPGGWPWVVYILIDGNTLCGGTVIDENWVLTAGHCFLKATDFSKIKMFFGRLKPSATKTNEPWVQERTGTETILHPKFDKAKFPYNDIALIRLNRPLVFGAFVHKVCLPNGERPKVGTTCWAVGYGTTKYRGSAADTLQEVDLPLVDHETCKPVYAKTKYPLDTNIMFCAGHSAGGKDACQGDSGGPLVCQRCSSCAFYIAGVTSFGKGCASAGVYGVYTDVEKYENWISQVTAIPVNKLKKCSNINSVRWHPWSVWSECSVTCGKGTSNRIRRCENGQPGQGSCTGAASEKNQCIKPVCPHWGPYGQWSDCSASCGGGQRNRTRTCLGGDGTGCTGETTSSEDCNEHKCPVWSEWGTWSKCSVTCGGGKRTAKRTCNTHGIAGAVCTGSTEKSLKCNEKKCPRWTQWTPWTDCNKSCGGGRSQRSRTCSYGDVGDIGCNIGDVVEEKACNEQLCGTWGSWSTWSDCTKTCGTGRTNSIRKCVGGTAGVDGCPGKEKRQRDCNTRHCPAWSKWSRFGPCSLTCNRGMKTRNRTCKNGKIGDIGCDKGSDKMSMVCNTPSCPKWTKWSSWSDCSKTCGRGSRSRTRSCSNGIAGDKGCEGKTKETKNCNTGRCPRWGNFTNWSACSVTCGGGNQTRTRKCVDGKVGQKGCIGSTSQEQDCNKEKCPEWGSWGPWGSCSVTCGNGQEIASRKCMRGSQVVSGCSGESEKKRKCQLADCPGVYGAWTEWSGCSKTCGDGSKTRTRKCVRRCSEDEQETKTCNQGRCPVLGQWSGWSDCSTSCGAGVHSRSRKCTFASDPAHCKATLTDTKNCFTICWGEWSAYSECSVPCGQGGKQERTRKCTGKIVPGPVCTETESKPCGKTCSSRWGDWSSWTKCTHSCSGGTQRRNRTCIKQSPQGPDCSPSDCGDEVRSCNEQDCPKECIDVDGAMQCQLYRNFYFNFCSNPLYADFIQQRCRKTCGLCNIQPGPWSNWSECKVSCGGRGITERRRKCLNPRGCNGVLRQSRACSQDTHNGFTKWTVWTPCSELCGGGTRSRERACPSGITCSSDDHGQQTSQSEKCNSQKCPGKWSAWSGWTDCSKTCGPGQQSRNRNCDGGSAGGPGCTGSATQTNNCQSAACPGKWGPWKPHGSCTVPCGAGKKRETRVCAGGVAGGPGCEGSDTRQVDCNLGPCVTKWLNWSQWGECSASCGGGDKFRSRACQHGSPGDDGCEGQTRQQLKCNTQECKKNPCAGFTNNPTVSCKAIISLCNVYTVYMEANCRLACCEEKFGVGVPTVPVCADNAEYAANNWCASSTCSLLHIQDNCRRTCGRC